MVAKKDAVWYEEGYYGGGSEGTYVVLRFPAHWIGTKLPPESRHPVFDKGKGYPKECFEELFAVEMLDTDTGKTHTVDPFYQAYEQYPPEDGSTTISQYFYFHHHCACHRKSDAENHGIETDAECEGERFKIVSVTAPKYLPGLVLYSETMTVEELNNKRKEVLEKLGL